MSQLQMAWLFRYAASGHPYFIPNTPLSRYFYKVFEDKGGMTPAISKKIAFG